MALMSICNFWISQWLCLLNGNNFCRNIMVEYVYYRWSEISSFSTLLKSFKTYYIANFTYSENELQDKFVLLGTNLYLGICLDSSLTVSYMRTFFCCHWATEWSPVWDHIEVDYGHFNQIVGLATFQILQILLENLKSGCSH